MTDRKRPRHHTMRVRKRTRKLVQEDDETFEEAGGTDFDIGNGGNPNDKPGSND